MKAKIWFRNGLLLLLCVLLTACTTPDLPEDSSVPAESSEAVPASEDANAKTARAYLEELLTTEWEWETGSDPVEWISSDRAEAIRASVKKLKTPFLTDEDVQRIAERAAAFYCAAQEENRTIFLPAYGVVRSVQATPPTSASYWDHAMVYNALLSYTFYLFTPPDYIFREEALNETGWSALFGVSGTFSLADVVLCLPLAGAYSSRRDALADGRCVLLYPPTVDDGAYLLDFSQSYSSAEWVGPNGCTVLELSAWAGDGFLRFLDAPAYVRALRESCMSSAYVPWEPSHDGAGALIGAYMPFSPETARGLREMADLLDEPLLLTYDFKKLADLFQEETIGSYDPALPILLPDADGTGEVTLEPDAMSPDERLRRAFAYTVDLFTPRAYRFTDLTDRAGTYYATGNWINDLVMSTVPEGGFPVDTPETMLEDFYEGVQQFILVTEDFEVYFIDGTGEIEPLCVRKNGGNMTD